MADSPCTDGTGYTSHDFIGDKCIRCGRTELVLLRERLAARDRELAETNKKLILVQACADAAGSQMLDLQQDCIAAKKELAEVRAELRLRNLELIKLADFIVAEVTGKPCVQRKCS